MVRDPVERIVREQAGHEGLGQGANVHSGKAAEGGATGALMTRFKALIERFDGRAMKVASALSACRTDEFDKPAI